MITHQLKIQIPYYEAIKNGSKNFEVRFNDRGFQKNDDVILYPVDKHDLTTEEFGKPLKAVISYVFSGLGIEKGFVVFGLSHVYEMVNSIESKVDSVESEEQ